MKQVVTEHDVESLVRNQVFTVDRDMILTPGARELLSRKGILVQYETARAQANQPVDDDVLSRIIEEAVARELSALPPAVPPSPAPPPASSPRGITREENEEDQRFLGRVLDAMDQQEPSFNRAVVTVVGRNTPGIVARISSVVAELGGDLADMSQVIVGEFFSLIFVVDLAGMEKAGHSFRLFKERLQDEAAQIGCVKILVMHEDIFRVMHKV